MKKLSLVMLALVVASLTVSQPAQAADDSAVSKMGKAIVWPFKKVGQGLKAMGNGAKKLVGKGK